MMPETLHFLRPHWFWALLPLLGLLWLLYRRRLQGAAWSKVCDPHLLPHILAGVERRQSRLPLALVAVGWVIAVIALAGPVWEQLPQPVYQSDQARVIVLDLSRSMDATDVQPSRVIRAKHKLRDILARGDDGQTALVVFSDEAFVVSPLTQDARTIQAMVPALTTDIMPRQGSRPDLALRKADELLTQGNAVAGDIILITDGGEGSRVMDAARDIRANGRRVSVLAVGTTEGAPIPVAGGGFLKNRHGAIVIPRLNATRLSELAAEGGGRFTLLNADDSDLDLLLDQPAPGALDSAGDATRDLTTDQWREEGPWLLVLLLPLAALAFRRGALACVMVTVVIGTAPPPAMALDWRDAWLRPDQQGARLLDQDKPAEAAARFDDPAWQGHAYYRAGQYDQAAQAFAELDSADGHYNRGNALAQQGLLNEALAAYEQALQRDEANEDARFNHELIKQLLEQQQQAQQNGDSGDSQQQENQQQQGEGQQQQSAADQQSQQQAQSQQSAGQQGEPSAADEQQSTSASEPDQAGEQHPPESAQAQDDTQQAQAAQQDDASSDAQQQAMTAGEQQAMEDQQAVEQWLRRIPDDPGGLLRRKFQRQYQQGRNSASDRGADAW